MGMSSPDFWVALLQIIGVNIVLSGDNAVVIALAARGLPAHQQKKAIAWGSGAAVVMRIILTIVAVELLRLPYLKLIGAVLLCWIAVQLLTPEDEDEGGGNAATTLGTAIKTILLADLVMSLDNVIGVAAAAKGSVPLLVIGLAISIPLVIFASQILLKLMERFPFIVTFGAGLLGWVSGEMAITDPAVKTWIDANAAWLHTAAPMAGVLLVLGIGRVIAARATPAESPETTVSLPPSALVGHAARVLVPVDGSEGALAAVRRAIELHQTHPQPVQFSVDLLNVQHPVSGDVSTFVAGKTLHEYHEERSEEALAPARALLQQAGVTCRSHARVGDAGTLIPLVAKELGSEQIVMGSRGLGAIAGALLGSVTAETLRSSAVEVVVVKD